MLSEQLKINKKKKVSVDDNLTFDDLPDEVIEFVLSFVSPYNDLHVCMLVCRRWRSRVLNVVQIKRRNLRKAFREFNIRWQTISPTDNTYTVAKRYSHAAVVHGNSMYVFGGCTNSMTTFNDLWRLDLSQRQWIRPLSTGVYPTPKACSSMVCYKDLLVLFGGWAYPSQYPYHQSYQLFNELHFYDTKLGKWNFVTTNPPPPMAGHSVSVHGHWMVVFGGMQQSNTTGNSVKTNDIWKLNLENFIWQKQETTSVKPAERYGHTHTVIDDYHILIMGGCGGPNGLYNDVWLLNMDGFLWTWRQVRIENKQWAPPDAWCHPTCRVNDCIVLLNRPRSSDSIRRHHKPPERRPHAANPETSPNVHLQQRQPQSPVQPSTSRSPRNLHNKVINQNVGGMTLSLSAFIDQKPNRSMASINREKQLDMLRKMENRINSRNKQQEPSVRRHRTNVLSLYVLDISKVLTSDPNVSWMQPRATSQEASSTFGPEETLLYTLVLGKSELIMFGGIQKDNGTIGVLSTDFDPSAYPTKVSNSLHFITAPVDII